MVPVPGEVFVLRKLLPASSGYDFNIHVSRSTVAVCSGCRRNTVVVCIGCRRSTVRGLQMC